MELDQLKTFIIVAEEKNMTKASERLFITQPALSTKLKLLEDELQVELFNRTSKGMELTDLIGQADKNLYRKKNKG